MKIVICGLGYVGVTTAACLARDGHRVVGIDIDPDKVAQVAAGISPVSEPGVAGLLAAAHAEGRLAAEAALGDHLDDADLVMVCVCTPSLASGRLDISQVIAVAAGPRGAPPLLVFRSTLPPGAMDGVVLPALAEAAGGEIYEVAYNPEFLRESTAIADYDAPAKIVIGERAPGASRRLRGIYDRIDAPVIAGAMASNQAHKQFLAERVMRAVPAGGHILLLGLSFKSDSDDLRESPLIDLAETLLGKGYSLTIFDPDLKGRTLVGANLRFVEERLPHLSRLLVDDVSAAPVPALVLLGKPMAETLAALDPALPVLDLVRL